MEKPHRAQYGGGMITNPELNDGLKGWSVFGGAKIEERVLGDNKFIVAHTRTLNNDSFSQNLYMNKDNLYTFSGTFISSNGKHMVVLCIHFIVLQ